MQLQLRNVFPSCSLRSTQQNARITLDRTTFCQSRVRTYEPQPLANATKRGMGSANSCHCCCAGTKATPITRMIKPEPLGTSSHHPNWRAKCKTNCICATVVQHCSEKPFLFRDAVRFSGRVVSARALRPTLVVRRRLSLLRCTLPKELCRLMQMCHYWGSKRERGRGEHQIRLSVKTGDCTTPPTRGPDSAFNLLGYIIEYHHSLISHLKVIYLHHF